jgi:hypothetical protein
MLTMSTVDTASYTNLSHRMLSLKNITSESLYLAKEFFALKFPYQTFVIFVLVMHVTARLIRPQHVLLLWKVTQRPSQIETNGTALNTAHSTTLVLMT